jgi:hypothetical protein
MLGQERRVHLGLALRAQMNTLFLGHGGGMLGLCGTYVGLLGAMLGPFWACWWGWNVDIQPAPPWIATSMAMLGLCGTYVGPMLEHVVLLRAMLVPFWAYVGLLLAQNGGVI